MENKYNELEKLNQLKSSGTITETEYEVEKYKILNSNTKTLKNTKSISTKCFIFVGVEIIFLIIFISLSIYHYNKADEISWKTSSYYTYIGDDTYKNEMQSEIEKGDSFKYASIIIGGLSTVFLITGIVFKIKEKGGIEIVN